jgi:radical SAM protein with 4Fe4S-binding SPASM domain
MRGAGRDAVDPPQPAPGSAGLTRGAWVPRTCVWELTLACNGRCVHCGSAAGRARDDELDTDEARALIWELARLGCESVTLSGGEPLLRPDWPELARAIRQADMRLELITNGLVVAAQADAIAAAGFYGVTFSVDGPESVHDALRGVAGGLQRLLRGAEALRRRGVRIGAATQVNRLNLERLAEIQSLLVAHGFQGWQVQLTMAHGRAAERDEGLCLAPEQLPLLEERLVPLCSEPALLTQVADNIGYMSRHEPLLRTIAGQPPRFWTGCAAGLQVVGITSNGTVRGCLSLPPAADEGNVRQRSLTAIWNDPNAFAYNRRFEVEQLSGPCAGCPFGRICRGGCRSLAWAGPARSPHANAHCIWRVTHVSEHGHASGSRGGR